MRERLLPLLIALLLAAASDARAQRVTEVYAPAHRLAEELIPVAQAALGDAGDAVLDSHTNSLVLIGPAQRVADALAVLRRQDRAAPVVTIHYRSLEISDLAHAGLEIRWEGGVGVGVGRVRPGRGAGSEGRLYRTRKTDDFAGQLRIQSGRVGRIGLGRSVPLEGRDRFGPAVVGVARGERGFSARPQVLGDGRIQLEFSQSDASVDDAGRVEFANASTSVIVASGETIALGSLAAGSRTGQGAGKSYATHAGEEKRIFLLTLEIESP